MQIQTYPGIFSEAAQLSNAIVDRLSHVPAVAAEVQPPLVCLAEIVECLPLDQAAYCYFRNRLISSAELLAAEEIAAARYQMREMSRKLSRFAASFA